MVQRSAGISESRDFIFSGVILLESHRGLCYACKKNCCLTRALSEF